MKAQFDYKSKKTLIIVAIALVLLIAAIIGTVAFIKGNNDSAAAMTEGDAQVTTDGENNGGDNNANPADNASEGTNNGEIPVIDDNGNTGDNQPANNAGNNSTTNGGTTSNGTTTGSTNNGTTTGTTNPNVPSEEYIQETIIQGEDKKVEETTKIGWEPVGVSALTATTKLGINKATLENQKFAYIEGDSLEDAPVKTGAQKGQKITYVIEIKNTSKMDANNIRIYDTIPEGTTLVENSISDQGINENGRIYWRTNIPAEAPVKLSFTVEITAQNGNILNFAMVDGNPTNETSTEVKHYYTVEHYKENLDGTYELVKTEKVEDVSEGDDTHYTLEEYKGFTPGEVENDGAKVPDNDDLVIKVKYDRNKYPYTINFVELGNETNILATEKGEAKYEDSVPVVEKTDITGFTFESKDKDNIVIDTENNTATVYYTRNSYKVTYKYEGKVPTGASTLPAEATYKYEENVTVAEKATAPGYKFSGWDKQNFTMPAENVVIKGSFTANKDTKYTVEHYIEKLDGTGFELKETTPKAGTTDTEVTATPNSYEGFEFDATVEGTKQSGIVTGDGKLVLKLYYTRNSYDYVINHVEKGNVTNVLAEAEKGSAKYGDTIAVNYKTNIEGFSYDSETTKEIEIKTTGNTATVYYTRNSYDYVINHVEKGNVTNVLAEAEKGSAKYGDTIDVNYKTNIEGFSYDSETTKKIEIKTTGNEATVYYTRNIHNVIYKITGTIDANENFATQEYKYGETITAVAEPTHKGYTFSGWSTIPTTMPDHDVIVTGNFRANTNTAYTVKHHLQKLNADASDKVNGYEVPADGTENKTGTTGTLTTATSKIYTGFTAQSFDQKTIAGNGTTVVDIYYTRDICNYTVKYYYEIYDETNKEYSYELDNNKTAIKQAQFGDTITSYDDKCITGYEFEKDEGKPLSIVKDETQNVINVYYKKQGFTYQVEYYTEDLNANTYTKVDSLTEKNLTGKFGDTATYTVKDITGFTYKAEKTTPQNATIPANNNLIIKLYYDRNSYNYTIEYYYDGEKDADATEPLSAEYGAQVSTYPDKSNGYTFESDTGAITIGTVVANNVIKVYYAKPTFSIVKTGATTAKVGETVTYTIRVTETSNKVGGTIKVTDALPEGLTFVEASDNGKQNADGDVEWSITLGKGEYKSVTVKATVNNNKIGMDITNIAILDDAENEEDKTKSEKTTSVDELQAVAHELTPGQTGKDAANIILVMDLSSSMNEKIKEFVECTHKHKTWWGEEYCPEGCTEQSDGTWGQWKETSTTRLAAAKKSAQDFINSLYTDSSSKATVTVVTFNKEEVSKNNKYVGPRVLKFGTAENQTTATSSNYTQLVEAIGNIDIGTATSGYGTYIKEALDTTYDTIYGTNGVASKYPNNSNYVIFLGDGEPSDKNDSYKTKINKSADKIKNAGATIYSIGFGEDVADSESTGYKVLYGISSTPKKVYTASDSVALTNIFKNLAGGMTDKPNETTDGKIVVTPARTLYFNTENGKKEYIIVQYKGTTILECKSQTELDNSAYLSYADGKLTFDINAWNSVKGNTQITTGGEDLVLNYYIVRAD